jgi:hypothetical protein
MNTPPNEPRADVLIYDRQVLTTILIYHWRTKTSGCGCGWGDLGKSHADHIADVYEQSVTDRIPAP